MNTADRTEFKVKEQRLFAYMDANGYDAVVIGTQANFAWMTCGGDSHVLITTDMGEAILVITRDRKVCIANNMDAQRIMQQELDGLGFELVSLKWFETSRDDYAAGLIEGKRALSDFPVEGAECSFSKFYDLHFPLTDQEVARYERIGRDAEEVMFGVATKLKKGVTGSEIETMLTCEFAKKKLLVTCMIIGVDEEISSWRHPIPWDKPAKECVMLVLCLKRYGLNVPITRMVYFNDVPVEIQSKFDAVCSIAADSILRCREGLRFMDLSQKQKALYKEFGYEKEWENHYVGGITGYIANDGSFCTNETVEMKDRQAFNWYVTITGVNTEDTMIITQDGPKVVTVNGIWPLKERRTELGTIGIPDILVLK